MARSRLPHHPGEGSAPGGGPPPSSPSGKQNRWADVPARFRQKGKRQQLRLQRLMRAHGAPGRGSFRGRWMRGGRSSSRPAPSLHRAAAPASPPTSAARTLPPAGGLLGTPPHAASMELPTHRPQGVWNWSAEAPEKPGGQARGQGAGGRVGGEPGGHGAGRDTHRTWGKTGCGPRSVGSWTRVQTHSGRSRPRAASGLCAGHKGSWAPARAWA